MQLSASVIQKSCWLAVLIIGTCLTVLLSSNVATAQVTYSYGGGSGVLASPTSDKGFLLHYQGTNGRLAYQKFDSNAVFQYGFTQPANQIHTSAQRFGKVFSLLTSSHEDTLRLQKIDMATGVVEINRKIGGPQYGTIGYFSYTPYHFVATQDSGLLVVLSRWQSYNWTVGMDVAMIKLNSTLNVEYVRFGGWQNSQSIVSRLVKEHSDGTIWHMTAVNNPQAIGYQLNIARLNGSTGVTVNQVTLGNMTNPTINGFTELPGRVVLSGLCASNEGWAMSIAPDLSVVHWYKRYAVPLNYGGAYELNAGPNGNLYGHMGDKVLCLRPSDGSVVWAVDVNGGSKVVPKFMLGTHKMLALHNPGGSGLTVTVMDSLGQGLCNTVGYSVATTSYTTTNFIYGYASYSSGGLTHFTLPNPSTNVATGSSTVVCSALCNFTAGFTSSVNVLTGNFLAQPIGLNSYVWNFGDGGTSTSPSPTHTYAAPGTYTVCLIGTSGCMSDTVCQQVTVACTATSAAFTSTSNLLSANFTNSSTGTGALTYTWDFGDGNTSTLASPGHTYAASGTYTVCLIATGLCGADTSCQQVTINCPLPVAGFTPFISSPLVVYFFNTSNSPGIIANQWNFGDGLTSLQGNPQHIYAQPGDYIVCLTVNTVCGVNTFCDTVTVTCPTLTAAMGSSGNFPTIQFTDMTVGTPGQWSWDFGDGGFSTSQNPSHTYASTGIYTVCLVASDNCSSDTTCQSVNVLVGVDGSQTQLVEVFPNPAHASAWVRWNPALHGATVRVMSMDGSILLQEENASGELELDLHGWATGVYAIEIKIDGQCFTRRLVVQPRR